MTGSMVTCNAGTHDTGEIAQSSTPGLADSRRREEHWTWPGRRSETRTPSQPLGDTLPTTSHIYFNKATQPSRPIPYEPMRVMLFYTIRMSVNLGQITLISLESCLYQSHTWLCMVFAGNCTICIVQMTLLSAQSGFNLTPSILCYFLQILSQHEQNWRQISLWVIMVKIWLQNWNAVWQFTQCLFPLLYCLQAQIMEVPILRKLLWDRWGESSASWKSQV